MPYQPGVAGCVAAEGRGLLTRRRPSPRNISALLGWVWAFLYLAIPFQAHSQRLDASPCSVESVNCFVSDETVALASTESPKYTSATAQPTGMVAMYVRASHRGPFAHHWLEVETSGGRVTLGFGPAILPFIDFGQISVREENGHTQRFAGLHLFSINYGYAKLPGQGRLIGKPVRLTIRQADDLVAKVRAHHFFIPYIPLFHDCRTFACVAESNASGKSRLPCYFLLKGYW